jgi:hypothetical protein
MALSVWYSGLMSTPSAGMRAMDSGLPRSAKKLVHDEPLHLADMLLLPVRDGYQ